MSAKMPRFAPAVKPRGMVATRAGSEYIWTMDEKEVIRRLRQPDKIIGREERMRSLGWAKRYGEHRADALSRAMFMVRHRVGRRRR
jgi:hypothetical protein